MQDVNDLQRFASKGPGVWVQASTLGSLEALLTFLQQMKIPVRNFAIGPVFRSHVIRAGRMLEVANEYALILAFDVPIDKEAKEYADKEGVKIFSGKSICCQYLAPINGGSNDYLPLVRCLQEVHG
jgi:translation initiation factor 5B